MDDTDAFFTHTVVGAPFSVVLGRRMNAQQAAASGLSVDLADGRVRLGQPWTDAWLLGRAGNNRGQPRRRPSTTLRWLERHALLLAGAGLAALAAAGALLTFGVRPWL